MGHYVSSMMFVPRFEERNPVIAGKKGRVLWLMSILPRTLMIPLSSMKGLIALKSPFSIRLFRSLCAVRIFSISALRLNSSGVSGPSPPLCTLLLRRIFSCNLPILGVTRISLTQLEKVVGSIASSTSAFEAPLTALT